MNKYQQRDFAALTCKWAAVSCISTTASEVFWALVRVDGCEIRVEAKPWPTK